MSGLTDLSELDGWLEELTSEGEELIQTLEERGDLLQDEINKAVIEKALGVGTGVLDGEDDDLFDIELIDDYEDIFSLEDVEGIENIFNLDNIKF